MCMYAFYFRATVRSYLYIVNPLIVDIIYIVDIFIWTNENHKVGSYGPYSTGRGLSCPRDWARRFFLLLLLFSNVTQLGFLVGENSVATGNIHICLYHERIKDMLT